MKFVCDRCQTKYSIADERVRGKVLKVKCKTCANVITVREARRPSSAGLPTVSAGARAKSDVHPPIDTSVETEERTQLAHYPPNPEADPFPDLDVFAPPAPVARRPTTGPLAPVAAADDGVQWYMALSGARTGPFTRQKLIDKLVPLPKHADVHIWNERLDGWKPPLEVPEVAGEMSRRRAPPPPPPLPGAPRRPTPPPIPPLGGSLPGGSPHGQPARKPTGPHAPHAPPSPVGHGAGGPGSKLPPPGGVHPALAARGAHDAGGDPSSLLETPAPQPHMLPHPPGPQKTNGVGGAGHGPPRAASSDVMQMLNLPGGTQTAPGAPPRLMSITSAIGTVAVPAPTPRSRSSIMILALLGVIGLIVVVAVISLKKPPKTSPVVLKPPTPPVEAVVEKPVVPETPPPTLPLIEPTAPPAPLIGKAGKRGGKQTRVTAPKGQPAVTPPGGTPAPGGDAARFSDTSRPNVAVNKSGGAARPSPAQADISKVISNNRAGIKICYQRALTRDNSLTHGKLAVKLSIGISGRVKRMGLEGPAQFRLLLEPCIKEVVSRWVFPQGPDEYETEFPLVFSGNE